MEKIEAIEISKFLVTCPNCTNEDELYRDTIENWFHKCNACWCEMEVTCDTLNIV